MLAGLPWMSQEALAFVDRPIAPTSPEQAAAPGRSRRGETGACASPKAPPDVAATITSDAHDFVSWATHRRKWSECVEIEGDEPYATDRVLDAMHIF